VISFIEIETQSRNDFSVILYDDKMYTKVDLPKNGKNPRKISSNELIVIKPLQYKYDKIVILTIVLQKLYCI
jgi:hypothetical protein